MAVIALIWPLECVLSPGTQTALWAREFPQGVVPPHIVTWKDSGLCIRLIDYLCHLLGHLIGDLQEESILP